MEFIYYLPKFRPVMPHYVTTEKHNGKQPINACKVREKLVIEGSGNVCVSREVEDL